MINIICIGKLKEKALLDLSNEYIKRLSKYTKVNIIELKDEKADRVSTDIEIEKIKKIECSKIKEKLNKIKDSYIISLDLKGNTYSSEKLAQKIQSIQTYNNSNITFIIGGSLGLNDEIRNLSSEIISFSTLTFPHGLFRIFLLEQIYRSFKINNNEKYHK